jgi:hypothetical protein
MPVAANFVHLLRPPMVVDLVTTLVNPARECSNDPSEMAAECRPSDPNFVPYYATDVNARGDDDGADGVVKHLLIGHGHEVDKFLY